MEWSDLEDAVGRQDWVGALVLAQEVGAEWRSVRDLLEVFAGPGAEKWSRVIGEALQGLLAALAANPVRVAGVDAAMSRLREFIGEDGAEP
ncbi:MAG: hypothetical protein KUG77_09310 [Nannocystaceae bacterium]|nr:hypothetical protein [Nannocystaceae bacterium]